MTYVIAEPCVDVLDRADNAAFFTEPPPGRPEPLGSPGGGGQARPGDGRHATGGRPRATDVSTWDRARAHGVLSTPARLEVLDHLRAAGRPLDAHTVAAAALQPFVRPHLCTVDFSGAPGGSAERP